jgi:hypothetical protein
MALIIAAVAGRLALVQGKPVVVVQPRSVVWGGRVFTNQRQLERWLVGRGASYQSWARHHQATARQLEILSPAGLAQGTSPPSAASDADRRKSRSLVAIAAVVGAAGLLSGGIAFFVSRRGRRSDRVPIRPVRRARRRRVGAAPMPSPRKLAGLVAAGVRSLERPAALVATRTVRAARGSGQRAVQNVGQLAVNAVS